MPTIVFSQPASFPIAALRETLTKHLPLYRWQCGEADTGAPRQLGSFADAPLIAGRSERTVIFLETRPHLGTFPAPAPPHQWWLHVGTPTTELTAIADRLLLLTCGSAMIADADDAHCQLTEGGNWLNRDELSRVTKLVLAGETLAVAAGIARPPAAFAAADPAAPAPGRDSRYADLPPDRAALPTLVMLSTAPLFVDWRRVEEGLHAIDREAGWSVEPRGPHTGTLRGRGATVTMTCENSALPPYLLAQGMAREHFLRPEQRALLASHQSRQAITVDLDTRAADFVDVRQAAKAVAMLMAPLAMNPGFVGLFNAGTGVATPVDRVRDAIGALAQDEVPIAIWTWVAVDSAVADAVSLSTAGMRPFAGFEVECWNAPGDLTTVAERLNGVIRYLLINGPVIKHGDTIGDTAGDRSTRCFLGDSKAQRGDGAVPAMLLEFDGRGGHAPRPDLLKPPDEADAALAAIRAAVRGPSAPPLRRVGGFGRKGL